MGLLPDDVDFDSPWKDASDDIPDLKKRIAELEQENERLQWNKGQWIKAGMERAAEMCDENKLWMMAKDIRAEIKGGGTK